MDRDTLVVTDDDLRLMICSAKPDTEGAERLALAIVLGIQTLVE